MDEKALLATVFDLAKNDPASALETADAHWPEAAARQPNPEDAETCRLSAVSAAELELFDKSRLWRARARRIGEQIPWPELIAALDMADAFVALARRNDDYIHGRTLDVIEGSPEAVRIMQSLAPIAEGPGSGIVVTPKSPTTTLIRPFVLEKTGSFLLALGDVDGAARSFEDAITHAEGPRGVLKSRGGLALANYLRASDAGHDDGIDAAAAETAAVASEFAALGEDHRTIAIAQHNTDVMRRHGTDLLLYEVL